MLVVVQSFLFLFFETKREGVTFVNFFFLSITVSNNGIWNCFETCLLEICLFRHYPWLLISFFESTLPLCIRVDFEMLNLMIRFLHTIYSLQINLHSPFTSHNCTHPQHSN